MKIKSTLYALAEKVRDNGVGDVLAKAWHVLAPPLPVTKKIYGVDVCLDFRDSLFWWGSDAARIELVEGYDRMLQGVSGPVWDVGCNVGVLSLYAARQGHPVVAFDISPKAIKLVEKSASRNRFKIATITKAFSVRPYKYTSPKDADTRNKPTVVKDGSGEDSITYLEVEAKFGQPAFIKMDIEHGEVEFLKSREFQQWIRDRRIPCLMELHEPAYWDLVWPDVPHEKFDERHVFFNPPHLLAR